MVTPGGTHATSVGRARRAATVTTSLATGIAVVTVLMSALADRVADDPLAFAELQGLADRLATLSGRRWVDSPPRTGTTVTAVVPD